MRTIDPHSLLDKPKIIENNGVIKDLYFIWKNLVTKKTDLESNDFDCFVAGFFLGTNLMLRQEYLKLKEKEN